MKSICTLVVIISVLYTAKATPLGELTANDRYYVSQSRVTFIEAMIDCKTRKMEMARIENETVSSDLTAYLTNLGVTKNNTYWLGGLRRNNGEWLWIETQEVVTYSKWASNQPGDGDDVHDFCVQLGLDFGALRQFEWESQICESHDYYICQFSEVPLNPTTAASSIASTTNSTPIPSTSTPIPSTSTPIPSTSTTIPPTTTDVAPPSDKI